tara:strand:+ start:45085 stop:45606 length:522 start_codon:yes stop_codon:yes gene_type:complete
MEYLFQIALVLIPAGAVLLTAIFFMRKTYEKELLVLNSELKKERQSFFLPNRVDAYQRAILLMERIHPNSMVMRLNNPGLPSAGMQVKLLEAIREEYEHNIAQQMYIAPATWDLVKKAKEETIKIINLAGRQMTATSNGMDLSGKIFEICSEVGVLPTEIAVDVLKKEVQQLF